MKKKYKKKEQIHKTLTLNDLFRDGYFGYRLFGWDYRRGKRGGVFWAWFCGGIQGRVGRKGENKSTVHALYKGLCIT